MAAEHIRKWRVGDVEIARIVEVYGFEDDITTPLQVLIRKPDHREATAAQLFQPGALSAL